MIATLRRLPWWAWAAIGAGVLALGGWLALGDNPAGPFLMLAGGGGGAEAVKRRGKRARAAAAPRPMPAPPQAPARPQERPLKWTDAEHAARPRPGQRGD